MDTEKRIGPGEKKVQFKWLFMKYEMAKRPYVLGLAILVTLLVTLNGCYFVPPFPKV